MEHWLKQTAAEQGRAIEDGRICPLALTEAYLAAIEAHPMQKRIYARLTRQRALDEAIAARTRARTGLRRGLLDGVTVAWKDLFDTAGVATESGSALLKGRVPQSDAQVLQAMSQGGSVCIGKTHMTELAFSGLGLNPVTATPPCINDPDAVPGGSSSGAAAAVAHGLAALSIGSDTGGSVRIPAAWNDLVGLKTTSGRLSLEGVVPLAPRFDTVGPLARSVEDCALALAMLERCPVPDLRGASLKGRRLLVLEGAAFEAIRPEPERGFEMAVETLAAAGAKITRKSLPMIGPTLALAGIIYTPECYSEWREVIEAQPEAMFRPILERFRSGRDHTAADYLAAWRALEGYRKDYLAATAGFDAVILPTAPNLPPDAARLMEDLSYFTTENLLTLRNTRIGNMLGLCVLTLPSQEPSVGISLMAPPMAEERLLRLGRAAEMALR